MEAQTRMLQVFTHEVAGAPPLEKLLVPSRSLIKEAPVGMKSKERRAAGSTGVKVKGAIDVVQWGVRREYKWYLFSDVLMICQPSRFAGRATFKELFQLTALEVAPSQGSHKAQVSGSGVMGGLVL